VEKPWSPWELRLTLPPSPVTGTIAELHGAVVERGDFRLGPIDLTLGYGDRLAIVGANGAGKSTLLQALLGELPLAAGTRQVGAATVFGLEQARDAFEGRCSMRSAKRRGCGARGAHLVCEVRAGRGRRGPPRLGPPPGERTRDLPRFAAGGVNCLVLDEPTNHLDREAIEELERALADYAGCVLVVSHDQRFLEALEVTRTISL
jgi:ATPase subunit of ABC transporter with duplicated ATPase domains